MENIACLSKSKLFQGIERKELENVCRFVVPSEGKFLKNQIIVNQGEVVSRVGILKKGTAFSTKYHFNGNELIRLMYKIDVLSKRTLQERILTYLSLIREKNNSDTFEIDMNQEQLAQYLCVNRSVLSKELNLMRRKEMIQYRGKRYTLIQAIR